jgi:transposase
LEARNIGRGGISKLSNLSGVSRSTIHIGVRELENGSKTSDLKTGRIRKPGGGRKKLGDNQKGLTAILEQLVSAHTRGDPMNPLIWTSKSLRKLEKELKDRGFSISYHTIGDILKEQGYSLQANRKTKEGGDHADRDAQFEFINRKTVEYQQAGEPVISVDCKKKELIGEYKNAGQEWEFKGKAPAVNVYDFIDKENGKAVPYGVYDIAGNEGLVNVGISHDTASFAVSSIRNWWEQMGKERYPQARQIFINADGGGSNGSKNRLWKLELQKLANETGLEIRVSHFPPGTSKWNKIEHRLFSFITMNWRAKPLVCLQTVVNLIASTTTSKGVKVKATEDKKMYEKGIKVSDEELKNISLEKENFHGEWNYIIKSNL